MDNELFELCKEVYKRFPSWSYEKNDKDLWFTRDEDGEIDTNPYIVDNCCWLETDEELVAPLYTSDYLLEKLPNPSVHKLRKNWRAFCGEQDTVATEVADTPLKALLKLVITLDDAEVKL